MFPCLLCLNLQPSPKEGAPGLAWAQGEEAGVVFKSRQQSNIKNWGPTPPGSLLCHSNGLSTCMRQQASFLPLKCDSYVSLPFCRCPTAPSTAWFFSPGETQPYPSLPPSLGPALPLLQRHGQQDTQCTDLVLERVVNWGRALLVNCRWQ